MVRLGGGALGYAAGPSATYLLRMTVRLALLVLAASQLVLAVWMVADPGSFFDHVGGFGPRNDHYLRDVATFEIALAVCAGFAVRLRSWRVPVLTFAVVQFAFH